MSVSAYTNVCLHMLRCDAAGGIDRLYSHGAVETMHTFDLRRMGVVEWHRGHKTHVRHDNGSCDTLCATYRLCTRHHSFDETGTGHDGTMLHTMVTQICECGSIAVHRNDNLVRRCVRDGVEDSAHS